ncbi:MAG: hypothetical protein AB7E81_03975 [Hyphomicrobiaceae bacterium]
MIKDLSNTPATAELRELSLDEIEAIAGAGFISWLKGLFGGNDPKPARGPFNRPDDHLK